MTVVSPENTTQQPLAQAKAADPNLQQQKIEPVQNNAPTQNAQAPQSETTGTEDPNWKAFREARKKDRTEREAAEKRAAEKEAEAAALKAAMEAAFAKTSPYPSAPMSAGYGYQEEETEDQKIDKKVQQALAAREAQYMRNQEEREAREFPQRLQQSYPDFNQTLSQENLDYLDFHYPEVSRPLQRLKDGYDKWSDIYFAVKKFVPNNTQVKKEAARADANYNKPRSISSPSLTQSQPAAGSHILSEERKAANWARMEAARRGVG